MIKWTVTFLNLLIQKQKLDTMSKYRFFEKYYPYVKARYRIYICELIYLFNRKVNSVFDLIFQA